MMVDFDINVITRTKSYSIFPHENPTRIQHDVGLDRRLKEERTLTIVEEIHFMYSLVGKSGINKSLKLFNLYFWVLIYIRDLVSVLKVYIGSCNL